MSGGDGTVVVVGAGIIGIACAHYLAADGRKVIVLDKGTVAGGCSHGNCGHVIPSHILPLSSPGAIKAGLKSLFDRDATFLVKPQLRLSFANWFLQFVRSSTQQRMLAGAGYLKSIVDSTFREYEALFANHSFDCGWRKSGLIYLFKSQRAAGEFSRENDLLTEQFGVAAQFVNGGDLPEFDPAIRSGLAGGFLYEDDALLRPDRLAAAWAQALRDGGVEFIEHCDVLRFEKDGPLIRSVITDRGAYEVDSVVVAAGAFSPRFAAELECSIPVLPGKGYSITFPRPASCPKTATVMPERNVAVTPFDDGLRFGSMMEFVGFDDTLREKRVDQLKQSGRDYFRSPPSGAPEEVWFGWRPMTWDSLPIIGRSPKVKNAVIAAGHGMMGVTMAPATGRLVSELVGERTPHIPAAPFSPARFAS